MKLEIDLPKRTPSDLKAKVGKSFRIHPNLLARLEQILNENHWEFSETLVKLIEGFVEGKEKEKR